MKSIFCSAYAAPIGYYKAIVNSKMIMLEQHEHYIKQSIRNRCELATANGILILTVPLSERKNNMQITAVQICYKTAWQRLHIKSMETAYKSSPFFEFYIDDLLQIYKQQPQYLVDWNNLIHQQIVKWLKLKIAFEKTVEYQKVYEAANDFRTENWKNKSSIQYHQVFESKLGFISNLSIYDLLFNCGNEAAILLKS